MRYPDRFADELSDAVLTGLDCQELRVRLRPAFDELLDDPRIRRAERLVLSGSGDSLFAATAVRPALRRWAGCPVEVLTSLELARYETPLLGPTDVVVGVSNSGGSSRTRESLTLARERGALTVALVGNQTGPLTRLADRVLHRPVAPPRRGEPSYARVYANALEYVATLLALYFLGLEMGRRNGRVADREAATWVPQLEAAVAAIGETARGVEPAVAALARDLASLDTIWVIGGGPNRGTADYVAAKFHEQLPWNGIAQDLEEWAHLQYFLTLAWAARSLVIVLAPPGNALDRAEELVEGITSAGGRAVVVGQAGHGCFPRSYARLDVPAPIPELLTPVAYHLPAQLLVLHLARLAGVPLTPLRRRDDYWLIRKGVVRTTGAGLH